MAVTGYLTREQAAEKTGCCDATLDHALRMYPQSVRTNFWLITGYRAGTHLGPYSPGVPGTPGDLFTICPW